MTSETKKASLFTGPIMAAAIRDAFIKLDPRQLIRNPVMFVTAIVAALSTVLWVRGLINGTGNMAFEGQLVFWLWLTVLFGNFAEAIAEGRGKAQAASLRATKADLQAKRLVGVGIAWQKVGASLLEVGDEVLVEAGDLIPADGEVIEGVASVNEAAITGESAPVIREAGGDRSAVTAGTRVLRATKRLADSLHARWTAVTVETPRSTRLSPELRARVASALKLASELGGSLATIPAASVIEGLRAHLLEARATAIVIGKSQRSLWFRLRHGSVVDQLLRGFEGVTVHVIPTGKIPVATHVEIRAHQPMPWRGVALGLLLVALTTALAIGVATAIGANAISLLYLIPVITTATLFGLRPALIASVAGALAYNFFFLPPVHTFTISDPQNAITFLVLTGVAVLASQMTGRLKREANVGARTAAENAAIASFGRQLAAVSDEVGTAHIVCEEMGSLLDVSAVLLKRDQGGIRFISGYPVMPIFGPIDFAAAEWAFDRGDMTGHRSSTLTASDWQFHPLITSLGVLAVLGICRPTAGDPVPPDRQVLFTTLLGQAALAHERIKLEAKAREVNHPPRFIHISGIELPKAG